MRLGNLVQSRAVMEGPSVDCTGSPESPIPLN